jgi:CubicO group peptidase (beta-lactamase class C family)
MLEIAKPEKIGFSAEALTEIKTRVEEGVAKKELAGAVVLIARKGQIAYQDAIGWRNITLNIPLQVDDIFSIASMTKPITTLATMMLYEEGMLELDTRLTDFLPDFAHSQILKSIDREQLLLDSTDLETPITIRHLLTHTSGIGYQMLDEKLAMLGLMRNKAKGNTSLGENMNVLALNYLLHQPGQKWTYGFNTDILGRLVELLSGMSLNDFFKQRIFEPLGMNDTFFEIPPEKYKRLAMKYDYRNRKLKPLPEPRLGKINFYSGGGGLMSTANDYAVFLQMLLNEGNWNGQQIIRPETVNLMIQNQIGELSVTENKFSFLTGKEKFGFGFQIYTEEGMGCIIPESVGSFCWAGIYNTWFWCDKKHELFGILLTQVLPFSSPESRDLWYDVQKIVYKAIE